jgi:hypothetical protein
MFIRNSGRAKLELGLPRVVVLTPMCQAIVRKGESVGHYQMILKETLIILLLPVEGLIHHCTLQ